MTNKVRDNITNFQEYSVYPPSRTITIFGRIEEATAYDTIRNLHALDSSKGMITILLSSDGGDVGCGLMIFDAIRALKNVVRIVAYGEVASMASVIYQAADPGQRYMSKNSYLLLHEGTSGTDGHPKDREEWERLINKQNDICYNIYLTRIKEKTPTYTKSRLKELLMFDKIFLAEEALTMGLADVIIE